MSRPRTEMQEEKDKEKIMKALNELSREVQIKSLLQDMLVDAHVCKTFGYDFKDYVQRLKNEIDHFWKQIREMEEGKQI